MVVAARDLEDGTAGGTGAGTLSGGDVPPGGQLTDAAAPQCPDPSHAGSRVRRRGLRASAAGTRQRFECLPETGKRHFFTTPAAGAVEAGRCQSIAETRGLTAAKEVAGTVLAGRTTDPAYDELELWMTWHEQAAVATARAQQPRTITHRRLARPEGRVNPNPYLPR